MLKKNEFLKKVFVSSFVREQKSAWKQSSNSLNEIRVTGCVCEKVAQNVAQSISREIYYTTLILEKSSLIICAISVARVTRLGKFSHNGRLFTLGSF
jgi:hypothetical protein